jgi:hypothetical protein
MASGDWQLDIKDFAGLSFSGHEQVVGQPKIEPYEHLVFVFVAVKSYGSDEFFVIDWIVLRDILIAAYGANLAKHGGVRPRNWETTHTAISRSDLATFKDRWETITDRLLHTA